METTDSLPQEAFWQDDSFGFIKPEEFQPLGIDGADIPPGTFAARKHPSQMPSRFGGNAYGFGFFEIYDRLNPRDVQLLQSISSEDPDHVRKYYHEINRIYSNIGLLKRFSKYGKPYYLIPVHMALSSLSNIKNKANEISKIVDFHRKKYLKERHKIGILTHSDDLLINDLAIRFKEHQFVVLDSFEKLHTSNETLDLVILPRDIYQILLMEKFLPRSKGMISKSEMEDYVYYLFGKVYNLLKRDGEIFIIAHRYPLKTNQTAKITFQSEQEEKNFLLFTHVFKTRKKYQAKGKSLQVNLFDFQRYLSSPYVEKEVFDRLLEGRNPDEVSLSEVNQLPYLGFPLEEERAYDQEKTWSKLLSVHFNRIFLKSLFPEPIRAEWKKRFSTSGYTPDYMIIYLGQKKPLKTTIGELTEDIAKSRLAGCPLPLLADYRNSFDYLIRTLEVLKKIKSGSYTGLPELFLERLREPLENKKQRYAGLNEVLKLMGKVSRLKRIKDHLNPDMIEGANTRVLENLEALSLFGFSYGEIREMFLIVVGHTPMGRILSGKMNEKALKPVSDLARNYDPLLALNLLRFCRLMSMAETAASKGTDLHQEELAELFDLYESMVRVVTSREMDWDRLLDERISSMGGIHNKVVRKILKMMNLFQFLGNWADLRNKGPMEKESLADYDDEKLAKIQNVIELTRIIEQFETLYLKEDPLRLSIFYRRLLNVEFHGTVHIFERVSGRLVFLLLWITVNVVRGDIINFNNILAGIPPERVDEHLEKVEEAADAINVSYLDLATLKRLGEQLYENDTAYIVGTGFQLRVNKVTQTIDITFIDMDQNIGKLETLTRKSVGSRISEIPVEDLEEMERLFADLESFYQSHLRLISHDDSNLRLPERQKVWFEKAQVLREYIRTNFIRVIFQPENIYSDLDLLFRHSPSLLHFVLPEFMALQDLRLPGKIYLKSPVIEHVLASTSKMQALIRRDRESFQDIQSLHKLAQREFGPMVAGIVGLNETQIEALEQIVTKLRENQSLFDALVKSFIFRDLGLVPEFRARYRDRVNPADHAQAGAVFLEEEKIPLRYNSDKKAHDYLICLVRYHNLLHHMIRGEFSFYAIQDVVDLKDKELFDAIFVGSFIMFSAMREDMIMEDLATRQLQFRILCHRVIEGKTTAEDHMRGIYEAKGHLAYAFEAYKSHGIPENIPPARYLESFKWEESERERYIQAGKMIYALERIFRLRGIRYVEFPDLANLMIKVPLQFIYKKRNYYGIGYATFERELFEALRIYNGLQTLSENVRHFIFDCLVTDEVRIFGFENVSVYLNYENLIKLLLISLLGARVFNRDSHRPVCLNFLDMVDKIEQRYEAVNEAISGIAVEKLWGDPSQMEDLFRARTGITISKNENQRILSIDFVDRINMPQKTSYMETITDLEQLKNYFHYSLQSLRRTPFYTEDYEHELEKAFEGRMREITDLMLDQAKRQMALLKDFREIYNLFNDLMDRSLDIGFTDEQRHRLNDIYELRKDHMKREKLEEIEVVLETIGDIHELRDYWDSIKWYLLNNRIFAGKEFESLIAKKFDEAVFKLEG